MPGWEHAEPTVTPLAGGITNRNYRVDVDGRSYVVRIPGERTELLGIDRAGEAEASRRAAALGLAPPVRRRAPRRRHARHRVRRRHIRRRPPTSSRPACSRTSPRRSAASTAAGRSTRQFPIFRVVEWHARDAAANGGRVPAIYDELHAAVRADRAGVPRTTSRCRATTTCCPANVLLAADRHWLIDFEYAGMNEALFDLANLSVNCGFDDAADERLLAAYDGDASDPRLARLGLMKVMSELREGMWAVVQQAISTLDDVDFAAYAARAARALRRADRGRRPSPAWLAEAGLVSAMRSTARVVVIGGGVAGASVAYHLAALGWTDTVVVERDQLTSGSTFHSAGLVGQLRSSVTLTRMMMYGTELYRRLHAETGHDPGWKEVGSLRLASSPARLEELRRQAGWAATFGLPLELVSTARGARAVPRAVRPGRRPRRGVTCRPTVSSTRRT